MPPAPADAARHLARTILAEGRFHQPSVPRPLHGVLSTIGDALTGPVELLGDGVEAVGKVFPGGVVGVWLVLALIVVGAAALLASRRSRRRLASTDPRPIEPGESSERASDLLRAAEAAERAGRLADAVRLRFRAGLVQLAERGAIAAARSTPTAEVSRTLRSPAFDTLARRFDEIAYGGSAPVAADVEAARREWPAVLRGSRRA